MVLLHVVTSDHPGLGFFNYSIKLRCKGPTGNLRSGVWLYLAEQ